MKKITFIALIMMSFNYSVSQTLDQDYYTGITGNTSFGIKSTDNLVGQSFTAGLTGPLTSIKVELSSFDSDGFCSVGDETVVQMELHAGDGFGGAVLGTSSNITVTDGYNALTEFIFSTPIPVVTGSMHTFEVKILSEDCGMRNSLEAVFNGTYPNGTSYFNGTAFTQEILFQTFLNGPQLSIDENKFKETFKFYPNPIIDFLSLENVQNLKGTKIYNSLSQLVIETKEEKIDFRHLNSGIYFLQVTTVNGIITKKVLKK